MNKYYNISWNKVIQFYKSDEKRGLSFKQLEINMRSFGKNNLNLKQRKNDSKLKLVLNECSLITIMLILLLILFGEYLIATAIVILNIISTYIFLKDKMIKINNLKSIDSLNYTDVWVMRAGVRDIIKAEELVVGDIVLLKSGEIVPADIRIIEAKNLKINERNILGEEFVSLKNSSRIDGEVNSLKEIYNMAFRGTRIISGEGKGVVVAIGSKTKLGNITKYFEVANNKFNSQENLVSIFKNKLNIYGALSIALVFLSLKLKGVNNYKDIICSMILVVTTFNFIELSKFMVIKYKLKILENKGINNLHIESFENLNEIDILFIDKLGVLTEEEMKVKAIYTDMKINETEKIDGSNINEERLMTIAILCNDSKYNKVEDKYIGNLMEGANLKFATENGLFKAMVEGKNKRIFEFVNDNSTGLKTTINRVNSNYRANIRGTLDEILDRSISIMIDGIEKKLDKETIEILKKIDFNFQNSGYITEAFAYRSFNYQPTDDENIENNLVFVGIIGYENPKKDNIDKVIKEVKQRGIVPILFTDDNKITAYRIAKDIGIVNSISEVISGVEMLSLDEKEIINVLSKVKVFCRVNSDIRNKIIELFVNNRYKVCSTGENLAHIPSVLLSEVSIAKGINAAALIKTLATMNIKDNILSNIIYLQDKSIEYKYNLDKSLKILKDLLLVEAILLILVGILSDLRIKFYVLGFNLIILPSMFTLILIRYDKLKLKILRFNEFIMGKWKLLKLR